MPNQTRQSAKLPLLFLSVAVSVVALAIGISAAPPSDFERTAVVPPDGTIKLPTDIAFAPDGRIFILEKNGLVKIYKDGDVNPIPFLDLTDRVNSLQERGLLGIALDPDFETNGYVYLYYTNDNPLENRVSRFTAAGDLAVPLSEMILWSTDETLQGFHQGGTVRFGPDGKLWFTMGDNGHSYSHNPPHSQLKTTYEGKMLRINKDGTIPEDNPFFGEGGDVKEEIWALGFRNPFRFTFLPDGRPIVGDVGETTYEEVNVVEKGGNYGWPHMEGPDAEPGCDECDSYILPVFYYAHDDESASVTGGPVYTASGFPSSYGGAYFYGDFVRNDLRVVRFNGDYSSAVSDEDFDTSSGSLVDIELGPDGNIYIVNIFEPYPNGAIYMYEFTGETGGGNGTGDLSVDASASPTAGPSPLTVQFSSTVEGDSGLTYSWDFKDGGTSSEPGPAHTFESDGTYEVELTVTGSNSTGSDTVTISVGSGFPSASMDVSIPDDESHLNAAPYCGSTNPANPDASVEKCYNAGDTISFSGSATDSEDGDLPESAFEWHVLFHHAQGSNSHIHPFTEFSGVKSGEFEIPVTGDVSADTWYEIILIVEDSDGNEVTTRQSIFPNRVGLNFQSSPEEIGVIVDGQKQQSVSTQSVVGFHRSIDADETADVGGTTYAFSHWQYGAEIIVEDKANTLVTPPHNNDYVAHFVAENGTGGTNETNETSTVPQWSNMKQISSDGKIFQLSADWTDDTGLDYAILSTNASGDWSNKTFTQPGQSGDSVSVLTYHKIDDSASDELTVSVQSFLDQMNWLSDNGYTTMTVEQLVEAARSGSDVPDKSVVITFDDGYLSQYDQALPILQNLSMVGTFYVATHLLDDENCIADTCADRMTPSQVAELHGAGMEVGAHTRTHPMMVEDGMSHDEIVSEILGSKNDVLNITGEEAATFSYPHCNVNETIVSIVKESGYSAARWCDFNDTDSVDVSSLTVGDNAYMIETIEVHSDTTLDEFASRVGSQSGGGTNFTTMRFQFEELATLFSGNGTIDDYKYDYADDDGGSLDVVEPNTVFQMIFNVPESGIFDLIFRVRTGDPNATTTAEDRYVYTVGDTDYRGGAEAQTTGNFVDESSAGPGDFVVWGDQTIFDVALDAGEHLLTVTNVEGQTGAVVTYDYMDLASESASIDEADQNQTAEDNTDDMSGTSDTSEFTFDSQNLADGTVVAWRIYAADADGNTASTDVMTFAVGEPTESAPAPPPSNPPSNPSSGGGGGGGGSSGGGSSATAPNNVATVPMPTESNETVPQSEAVNETNETSDEVVEAGPPAPITGFAALGQFGGALVYAAIAAAAGIGFWAWRRGGSRFRRVENSILPKKIYRHNYKDREKE